VFVGMVMAALLFLHWCSSRATRGRFCHPRIAAGDRAVVTASGRFAYPLPGTSVLWLAAKQDGGWR
jgi:hypothetical protein